MKTIYELELHETLLVRAGLVVDRVPGGWNYQYTNVYGQITAVFVPYFEQKIMPQYIENRPLIKDLINKIDEFYGRHDHLVTRVRSGLIEWLAYAELEDSKWRKGYTGQIYVDQINHTKFILVRNMGKKAWDRFVELRKEYYPEITKQPKS